MNLRRIKKIAEKNTPKITVKVIPGTYREDVISSLHGNQNIGIELGVAQGVFSKKMMNSRKFSHFYGIDMYADTIHNTNEYKLALRHIGLDSNYKLLRMTFDDALDLFEDNYFDFIYIDGFAHTGEDGGETLRKWYKKLKIGGVFAGDDYHSDWPLVIWAVNDFSKQINSSLSITDMPGESDYCHYPSWFIKKEYECKNFIDSSALKKAALKEKNRVERRRLWMSRIRKIWSKAQRLR